MSTSKPKHDPPLHIGPALAFTLIIAWSVFLLFQCAQDFIGPAGDSAPPPANPASSESVIK